ncbi:uncharacterized protein LOC114527383 [Dendronephthya gigantea]|uniref:uncharacterized protein LOC114527383 n=1 Tax=Dendronephthya gigantea TaxID=151771 RepID=UPI00106AE852|nr:uncharacterized protein LOC114527383 [Dendronephthya gigantea]
MAEQQRPRANIDYKILNNLCSADLFHRSVHKQRKIYKVERIISKRQGKEGDEYLVKWENWPSWTCSWEPAGHLNDCAIRSYTEPNITKSRLDAAAATFVEAVLGILKSKSCRANFITKVPIDNDIIRYVFRNKGISASAGYMLYEKEDFSRFCLPPFWDYYLDELGQGVAVDFPVKLKPILKFHPKRYIVGNKGALEKGPLIPLEKISMSVNRKAASIAET